MFLFHWISIFLFLRLNSYFSNPSIEFLFISGSEPVSLYPCDSHSLSGWWSVSKAMNDGHHGGVGISELNNAATVALHAGPITAVRGDEADAMNNSHHGGVGRRSTLWTCGDAGFSEERGSGGVARWTEVAAVLCAGTKQRWLRVGIQSWQKIRVGSFGLFIFRSLEIANQSFAWESRKRQFGLLIRVLARWGVYQPLEDSLLGEER